MSTRRLGSSLRIRSPPVEKKKIRRENWTARYPLGAFSPPTSLACDVGPSHSLPPTFNEPGEGEEKQSSRILLFPVTYDEDHVHDFRQGGCKCLIASRGFPSCFLEPWGSSVPWIWGVHLSILEIFFGNIFALLFIYIYYIFFLSKKKLSLGSWLSEWQFAC